MRRTVSCGLLACAGQNNVSVQGKQSATDMVQNEKWYRRGLYLLPMLGAASGPLLVTGDSPLVAKIFIGLSIAGSFSVIGAKGYFVAPFATVLAGLASLFMFAGLTILGLTSSVGGIGTVAVGAVVAASMYWALTR